MATSSNGIRKRPRDRGNRPVNDAPPSLPLSETRNKKLRVYSPNSNRDGSTASLYHEKPRPIPRSIRNISSNHSNIINRLFNRATSCTKNRFFQRSELTFGSFAPLPLSTHETYKSKYKIVGELDTHDPRELAKQKLSFLMNRSPIIEIISSEHIIYSRMRQFVISYQKYRTEAFHCIFLR